MLLLLLTAAAAATLPRAATATAAYLKYRQVFVCRFHSSIMHMILFTCALRRDEADVITGGRDGGGGGGGGGGEAGFPLCCRVDLSITLSFSLSVKGVLGIGVPIVDNGEVDLVIVGDGGPAAAETDDAVVEEHPLSAAISAMATLGVLKCWLSCFLHFALLFWNQTCTLASLRPSLSLSSSLMKASG